MLPVSSGRTTPPTGKSATYRTDVAKYGSDLAKLIDKAPCCCCCRRNRVTHPCALAKLCFQFGQTIIQVTTQTINDNVAERQFYGLSHMSGFSVHANVSIDARDRLRLEDLQPDYNPVGADRMALNDDNACGASVVWRKRSGAAELR